MPLWTQHEGRPHIAARGWLGAALRTRVLGRPTVKRPLLLEDELGHAIVLGHPLEVCAVVESWKLQHKERRRLYDLGAEEVDQWQEKLRRLIDEECAIGILVDGVVPSAREVRREQ